MAAHHAFYKASLNHFVEKHFSTIAEMFQVAPEHVDKEDLVLMMEHSMSDKLRAIFNLQGRFDTHTLYELSYVPPEQRDPKEIAKAIARQEIGMAMNKPIHKATQVNPHYGRLMQDYILDYRRNRMRRELQMLATSATEIESHTLRLLSSLDRFQDDPSFENRLRVKAAMNAVNKSLIRAHKRARIGAVWALRAGFSSEAVTKAIHRLYTKRMKTLSVGMSKLDQHLNKRGFQSRIAEGISRRQRIISREMLSASANPELLTRKARYPNKNAHDILSEITYG